MPDRHPIIAAGLWASVEGGRAGEREAGSVAYLWICFHQPSELRSLRNGHGGEQITRGSDLVNAREVIGEDLI
jgi:hypothetical protein